MACTSQLRKYAGVVRVDIAYLNALVYCSTVGVGDVGD